MEKQRIETKKLRKIVREIKLKVEINDFLIEGILCLANQGYIPEACNIIHDIKGCMGEMVDNIFNEDVFDNIELDEEKRQMNMYIKFLPLKDLKEAMDKNEN